SANRAADNVRGILARRAGSTTARSGARSLEILVLGPIYGPAALGAAARLGKVRRPARFPGYCPQPATEVALRDSGREGVLQMGQGRAPDPVISAFQQNVGFVVLGC